MKRAQAAMEFLMTYGWAILAVLAAISALAYFGILNPEERIPESCIFFPGLSCTDFKVDTNTVTLIVTNGIGHDLETIQFTIMGTGSCEGDSSVVSTLSDGETKTFTITCTQKPNSGTPFRKDIQVNYREINGLNHSRTGKISTKVE